MATKKPLSKVNAVKNTEADIAETKFVKEPAVEPGGFCVYIGPSIRGVIQSGTVYEGSRERTEAILLDAIKKHPLIAKLISTDKTFAADRIKVKTAGNSLNVYYKKLASGN